MTDAKCCLYSICGKRCFDLRGSCYDSAVICDPTSFTSCKGAGASEAGGQTKEGPLSKRYFQTSKIAQNRTKSPVPIVIDVFGVTAPYGNPYGSKIAIVWLFFVIF